jgi:hypothetical protein
MLRCAVDLIIEFFDMLEHSGHQPRRLRREVVMAIAEVSLIRFVKSLDRQVAGLDCHARVM